MAIYYLDYVNGNDANDGTTWALAWKTSTLGATAARIIPLDFVRVAKSPDPTSLGITALWTNLSKTVTLASALNANVDLCETAWTASANVTATASATRKEGSFSASLAIAAGFTTGKVAYKALGASTDFSAYQQLSLWIQNSDAIATGAIFRVCLCSDTIGDTIVDSFYIKAIPSTGQWIALTIDKAAALGAAIQSVALYADSDPGTITLLLDDIITCKAASAADSLSLNSRLSKNSAAYGGDEGWWGIQSINGTTVLLDQQRAASATAGRGYSGTTETVTTYKRETIKTDMVTAAATVVQDVMDSGTAGNPITFSGGWNTATTTQDGETVFDGQNGFGQGLRINAKSFITIERICCTNYDIGMILNTSSSAGNNYNITATNLNNNTSDGIKILYLGLSTINITNMLANGSEGVYFYIQGGNYNSSLTFANCNSNGSTGIQFAYSVRDKINMTNCKNNGSYGIQTEATQHDHYFDSAGMTIANNGTAGIYKKYGGHIYLENVTISEATEVNIVNDYFNAKVFSHNHDGVSGVHKIFTDGGVIDSEATVRHTASGIAWRLSPLSTNRSSSYPLDLQIAKIAVNASALVTVKAWMRRSNTGLTMSLVCRGGQIAGVASDVVASMTAAIDTWEQIQISFTPSENGVVEIEAWAYGGTAYNGYVDDLEITQA